MQLQEKSVSTSPATCSQVNPAAVEQVFKWIAKGHTEADIVEAVQAQWPAADARSLIVAAIDQIRRAGNFDDQLVRGWCFEATRHLYRQMAEIGDFAGALRAVKQLWDFAKHQPPEAPDQPELPHV